MKKLILICTLLISVSASAQILQKINSYGYEWKKGQFDSTLKAPQDTTVHGPLSDSLAFAYKNRVRYIYNGVNYIPDTAGLKQWFTPSATTITLSGDVSGSGTSTIPTTLATVNSNVFGTNTFLKFGVNGKGLVTGAAAVASGDITGALGFTPYNSTNPSGYISLTGLSGVGPVIYNNATGAIQFGNTDGSTTGALTTNRYIPSGGYTLTFKGNGTSTPANLAFTDVQTPTVGNATTKQWIQYNPLSTGLPFSMGTSSTLYNAGDTANSVFTWGQNLGPGVLPIVSGKPALGYSLESWYQPNAAGQVFQEAHMQYVNRAGTQIRPFSYTINTATQDIDYYNSVSRMYLKMPATSFVYHYWDISTDTASVKYTMSNKAGSVSMSTLADKSMTVSNNYSAGNRNFYLNSSWDFVFLPGMFSSTTYNQLNLNTYPSGDGTTNFGGPANRWGHLDGNIGRFTSGIKIGSYTDGSDPAYQLDVTGTGRITSTTLFGGATNNGVGIVQIKGKLTVDTLAAGTSGTDSIVVWNSTTHDFRKIAPGTGGTSQTLTYTPNATNNTLAISAGNTVTFLTATSTLAGLIDTMRLKWMDSVRLGQNTTNIINTKIGDTAFRTTGPGLAARTIQFKSHIANNGVSEIVTDSTITHQLGGNPLIQNTTINNNGFNLTFSGTGTTEFDGKVITGTGTLSLTPNSNTNLINIQTRTYNDATTAASGSGGNVGFTYLSSPTVSATNTGVTYTGVSTLVVAAPGMGTNTSVSNSSRLYAIQTTGNVGITGNLFAGHLNSNSPAPAIAAGTGAGTSPTGLTGPTGDAAGQITVTTGTTPTASAAIVTITFNTSYNYANGIPPTVVITPGNAAAAALSGTSAVYAAAISATGFTLQAGSTALAASTAYIWNVHVIGAY